jgi:hypothetical protein
MTVIRTTSNPAGVRNNWGAQSDTADHSFFILYYFFKNDFISRSKIVNKQNAQK